MSEKARFPKQSRLTQADEYQRVFRLANRRNNRYFTVFFAENQLEYPRLGLAISKSKAKSAVVRNRFKRIIRESFRLRQFQLGGHDFVVLNRSGGEGATRHELHAALEETWQRVIRDITVDSHVPD